MRKENVTPSGTAAVRKPMKSGTAEQEQKGVTIPSRAANTLSRRFTLPGQDPAGAFRGKEGADDAHSKNHQRQQHENLGHSKKKNSTALPRCVPSGRPNRL